MSKFRIIGILEPGRINAKIDGRFTDITLHGASDEILAKLYASECPYVELTPEEFLTRNPTAKKIDIRPINVKKK
jgi:hypothetical protein